MEVSDEPHVPATLSWGESLQYPLNCGCVGARADLDIMAKIRMSCLTGM